MGPRDIRKYMSPIGINAVYSVSSPKVVFLFLESVASILRLGLQLKEPLSSGNKQPTRDSDVKYITKSCKSRNRKLPQREIR